MASLDLVSWNLPAVLSEEQRASSQAASSHQEGKEAPFLLAAGILQRGDHGGGSGLNYSQEVSVLSFSVT